MISDSSVGERGDSSAREGTSLKAAYFDLDGTLLDENRKIPDRALAKLERMKGRGIKVGVATGRMFASARPFVETLGSNAPLIIYNGARIAEPSTGRVLFETLLEAECARQGLAVARSLGVHVNLYIGPRLYMDSRDRFGQLFLEKENLKAAYVSDLETVLDTDPVKILFIGEPEVLEDCRRRVAEATENGVTLVFSEPDYLEMLPRGVSKGRALARACQLMKIDLAEVAAFGDAPNDAEMLEMAGMGVAMENAAQPAKSAARIITGPNHGDGIVDALDRLFPEP
jgi:Cof subfamily protein (haloacid dehalogenase superfamily)